MPTITFTIDDTIAGVGPKKLSFFPREAFATPAGGLVPNDGPKPIKDKSYARGTVHTESLPEGPWWVAGLSPEYIPIDVGSSGGDLKDLIVWGVPQNTPATTLAQAVATWMDSNVNTEVSDALIAGAVSTPGSEAKTALDATYAPVFPTTGITYDGDGNVQTVTDNGVTTTYTYNPDGSVATDTRLGVTRTYGYDGSGNLTSITVEED